MSVTTEFSSKLGWEENYNENLVKNFCGFRCPETKEIIDPTHCESFCKGKGCMHKLNCDIYNKKSKQWILKKNVMGIQAD